MIAVKWTKAVSPHAALIATVIEYLNRIGHFAYKNQTGGYLRHGVWIAYGHAGSPDIYCFLNRGSMLCVECKKAKDDQRERQRLFESIITKLGHKYILAYSFEEFERKYSEVRE